MLSKQFAKAALVLIPALFVTKAMQAQYISKISAVSLYDKMPVPPATLEEVLNKCQVLPDGKLSAGKLYETNNNELLGYVKANSAMNAENQQRNVEATKLAGQMQKDNVEGMTDAQKMEYARNNMAGKNGAPSQGTMDFAKQMQDPAFQAKFKSMTPQEQMAYMKGSGVVPGQNNFVAKDAGVQHTQQAFMEKMRDPAFREEWKKKDKQQQDAYINQLMIENNVDQTKLAKEGRAQAAATPAPEKQVLENLSLATQKLLTDNNHTTAANMEAYNKLKAERSARHMKINEDGKAQVEKLPIAGRNVDGPYKDPQKIKEVQQAAMEKHIQQAKEDFKNGMAFWTIEKDKFRTNAKAFDEGLQQIHYGEDVKNETEKKMLPLLSGTQTSLFTNVKFLNQEAQEIIEENAYWLNLKRQIQEGKAAFPFNYGG